MSKNNGIPSDRGLIFVAQGGLKMDQAPPDDSLSRKLYQGNDAKNITLLEPCVTGIFKASVRDNSTFSGKKSPFIAYDKQWSLRYNLRNVNNLFEVMHGKTLQSQSGTYRSYLIATLEEAFLHVQFAKPLQDIPR